VGINTLRSVYEINWYENYFDKFFFRSRLLVEFTESVQLLQFALKIYTFIYFKNISKLERTALIKMDLWKIILHHAAHILYYHTISCSGTKLSMSGEGWVPDYCTHGWVSWSRVGDIIKQTDIALSFIFFTIDTKVLRKYVYEFTQTKNIICIQTTTI
jgi:hypothetical protein